MGGSSKVATKMVEEASNSFSKASVAYPTWNVNATDELDDSALMDLVMARAAVIAAMRMCSPEDLPMTGKRLAESMSLERRGEEEDPQNEPMAVETNLKTTDKAKKDLPCYVHPALTSELCWRDINNLREQRRDLLLRGLPRRLCSIGGMKKLLGAVGLDESVTSIRAQCAPGRRVGHAILRVKDASDLRRVAHFFHGWQCGPSMPIAVSFFSRHSKGLLGGARPRPGTAPAPPALRRASSSPAHMRLEKAEELPQPTLASFQRRSTD